MKPVTFKSAFNPIMIADYYNYLASTGERAGKAPPRSFMQHRNQTGYTRIKQTKCFITVEWLEY